jgi:hypothetical protein
MLVATLLRRCYCLVKDLPLVFLDLRRIVVRVCELRDRHLNGWLSRPSRRFAAANVSRAQCRWDSLQHDASRPKVRARHAETQSAD